MTGVSGKPLMEIHYQEDWAALYVNGVLDRVGDADNTVQRALELCGVVTVMDDAFMRGQDQREGVAPTLDAVAEYRTDRECARALAADLRARAAALLAEASATGQ